MTIENSQKSALYSHLIYRVNRVKSLWSFCTLHLPVKSHSTSTCAVCVCMCACLYVCRCAYVRVWHSCVRVSGGDPSRLCVCERERLCVYVLCCLCCGYCATSHVVVCCSVSQCVAVCCSMLQYVAVCCSVLQYVTICCSMLQCVAECCSMLQYVAVYCSALQ